MPNLNDIVEIAEALESKAVFAAEERCVVVRNRNAKCRKCVEACPSGAIEVGGNRLTYSARACVSCGACTVVCPTETLIPMRPLDEDLATSIAQACVLADGTAVFACARAAAKRTADPNRYAEVPCLARMEESVLMGLAAHGVSRLVLVDGTCKTCKYRACNPGIDATVASVNTLLEAEGISLRVERMSEFPEELRVEETTGLFGVSRRGFFTQAKDVAKDAAEKAAVTALKKELEKKAPSLRDRLKMNDKGSLPQFNAMRRMHVLDAMDTIGMPIADAFETRLWGNVQIDTEKCSSCFMCTTFCPTGALRKSEEAEDGKVHAIEFSTADCVQCRMCEDICLKKCITVSDVVSTSDLFDFEPRVIELPEPPKKAGLISNLKRR
ncbi:4Fe-4S dicluster domain-containing protein [Raoultibacter phocaeensis]|uniref:4Fe-4S dicluster domain-containing protein n=1 Tax=Raoultibacter phocaeensis TaxID=2479841 RepID=UPI0011196518|nr:4Fe-4S dicluster domain-containing protein [Raoultibacter phocaeensis]